MSSKFLSRVNGWMIDSFTNKYRRRSKIWEKDIKSNLYPVSKRQHWYRPVV